MNVTTSVFINADDRLKRTITEETVAAIAKNELGFVTREQILYFEFDGKREKRVLVKS